MGKYNSGLFYNKKGNESGLIYNYGIVVIYVNVSEILKVNDLSPTLLMKSLVKDSLNIRDFHSILGLPHLIDYFKTDDTSKVEMQALISIIENLNITDDFINAVCYSVITDSSCKILDEIDILSNALITENLNVSDLATINSLISLTDELKLTELTKLFADIYSFDNEYVLDKQPRKAISDFYIGSDKTDDRFRWLSPFNLMVNEDETQLQVMPVSESEYIDLPKTDGSIVKDTVYKNRIFNVMGYSLQGMTEEQKDELQQKICEILDSTKDEFKNLTIERTETTFQAKYVGQADFGEAPTWIKANIPLEIKPYGKKLFPIEFNGKGIIINDGDKELGIIVTINSGCINPHFMIGTIEYKWNGTVPNNSKLIIDFEDTTCYLIDEFGVKTNALNNLVKSKWTTVPKKTSVQFTCLNESSRENISVEYSPFILWKKI